MFLRATSPSPAPFTQVFRLTCAVTGTGIPKIASHVAHSALSYLGRQAAVAVLASAFALQTPRSPHLPDPIPPHAKSDAHQPGGANASSSSHRYLTTPDLPGFTFLLQLCYLFLQIASLYFCDLAANLLLRTFDDGMLQPPVISAFNFRTC